MNQSSFMRAVFYQTHKIKTSWEPGSPQLYPSCPLHLRGISWVKRGQHLLLQRLSCNYAELLLNFVLQKEVSALLGSAGTRDIYWPLMVSFTATTFFPGSYIQLPTADMLPLQFLCHNNDRQIQLILWTVWMSAKQVAKKKKFPRKKKKNHPNITKNICCIM